MFIHTTTPRVYGKGSPIPVRRPTESQSTTKPPLKRRAMRCVHARVPTSKFVQADRSCLGGLHVFFKWGESGEVIGNQGASKPHGMQEGNNRKKHASSADANTQRTVSIWSAPEAPV